MLRWFKDKKAFPMAVCISLLMQAVWPAAAAAYTQFDASKNDAVRNGKIIDLDTGGLYFAMGRRGDDVIDTLPDFGHTKTNKYDFDVRNGVDTMYVLSPNKMDTTAVPVAARIDSTKLDPASLPGLTLWNDPDPFTQTYLAYDAAGLVGHARDTLVFAHVIIDSSLIDSAVMLGADTALIESTCNRINITATNAVGNTIGVNDPDSLVSVFWDLDNDGAVGAGDSLLEPADWFTVTPGETMRVLVRTVVPIVSADSTMDTVSLAVRTRDNARGRHLTKVYKDVITIELMQAMDAVAWVVPETLTAGAEEVLTYNLQLVLGTADEFRIVNPFADPDRYGPADTRDYDSVMVDLITFGYADTFGLKQDTARLSAERDSATWHYDRATDTLYVKFADSYVLDTDTLRIRLRQYAPTVVRYDSVGTDYSYAPYEYPCVFDDHIDPTVPDLADTFLGVPRVWVIPDTAAPMFSLVTDAKSRNIHESINIDVTVRDTFANRILTYTEPGADITLEPRKINGGGISPVVRFSVDGAARTSLVPSDTFRYGRFDSVTATAGYRDTVVVWFRDTVNNVYGFTDTLYWIDSIAPEMHYAATYDTNGNGMLDRVVIRFDSPVQGHGLDGFRMTGGTDHAIAMNGFSVVDDSTMNVSVYEEQWLLTGTAVAVAYDSAAGDIKDLAELENPMRSFSSAAAVDSAAPVLMYAFYYDHGTGSVGDDTIQLVYSEPLADSTVAADPAGEFVLYDSVLNVIPGGFLGMDHVSGGIADDDTTLLLLSSLSTQPDVGHDRMNIVPDALDDRSDSTISAAPGNQVVTIQERTPPQLAWISPADTLPASQVVRLYVKTQVTEWQGIGRNAVSIDWYVPEVGSLETAGSLTLRSEIIGMTLTGDSLVYTNPRRDAIDLTDYPTFADNPIRGGYHVIFNARAYDDAGNQTYVPGIETLTVVSFERWFHCSRGTDEGYDGIGYADGVGPYDAWAYVPENTIIFDSVAIRHYYNGELRDDSLEMMIRDAGYHLNTLSHIARIDSSDVKIHEYAMVDKFGVSRRHEEEQQTIRIDIYVDDLEDVDMDRLTLFRLNDYQVRMRNDGTLDTLYGDGEWVPLDGAVVDADNMVISYEVDLHYVQEGLEDVAVNYGLGVYAVMEYTPPSGILTSVVNSPNPFDAGEEMTKITYVLTADAEVTVSVFDAVGDLVWKRICDPGEEGGHGSERGTVNEIEWDGRNGKGRLVANGGYLCRIKAVSAEGTAEQVRKIGVMK